jgi:hypothetical protein
MDYKPVNNTTGSFFCNEKVLQKGTFFGRGGGEGGRCAENRAGGGVLLPPPDGMFLNQPAI